MPLFHAQVLSINNQHSHEILTNKRNYWACTNMQTHSWNLASSHMMLKLSMMEGGVTKASFPRLTIIITNKMFYLASEDWPKANHMIIHSCSFYIDRQLLLEGSSQRTALQTHCTLGWLTNHFKNPSRWHHMICSTNTKQKTRKTIRNNNSLQTHASRTEAVLLRSYTCSFAKNNRPSTKPSTLCWLEAPTRGQIILVRWWSLTIAVINLWTVSHETTGINQTYTVFLKMHKVSMRDVIRFFPSPDRARLSIASEAIIIRTNDFPSLSHLIHGTEHKTSAASNDISILWGLAVAGTQAHWSHEHKICCEVSEQETISWPFDVRHDETRWILVHSFDADQMSCN